jgi:hypothetical protein
VHRNNTDVRKRTDKISLLDYRFCFHRFWTKLPLYRDGAIMKSWIPFTENSSKDWNVIAGCLIVAGVFFGIWKYNNLQDREGAKQNAHDFQLLDAAKSEVFESGKLQQCTDKGYSRVSCQNTLTKAQHIATIHGRTFTHSSMQECLDVRQISCNRIAPIDLFTDDKQWPGELPPTLYTVVAPPVVGWQVAVSSLKSGTEQDAIIAVPLYPAGRKAIHSGDMMRQDGKLFTPAARASSSMSP